LGHLWTTFDDLLEKLWGDFDRSWPRAELLSNRVFIEFGSAIERKAEVFGVFGVHKKGAIWNPITPPMHPKRKTGYSHKL
jgi:hypothetical protein